MNKLNSVFDNSELIAKKLTGRLTKEESDHFQQWLDSSEQNGIFFRKIQDRHRFFSRNERFEHVDARAAWRKINEAITVEIRKRRFLGFLKYAAVVLLALSIGTTGYFILNRPSDDQQIIQPGAKNAFLLLSNGKSIDLGKEEPGVLKETDGTVIKKSNDELHYTKQERHEEKKVLQDELVVPRGGEYSLVLADGTRVFLNSMSRLVFPVRFSGDKREVFLEGEGYFEVQKDEKHPFVVQVSGMSIQVLGTSFNVKAYQDEPDISATLVEGKVRIKTGDQPEDAYTLEPDQQAVFDKGNATVTVRNVDAATYTQWTAGRYVFTDQPLDEIMKTLSRWYDFEYHYHDESIKTMRFEGGLNKYESIYPILDIISRTGKVKVTLKGKEILFSRQ